MRQMPISNTVYPIWIRNRKIEADRFEERPENTKYTLIRVKTMWPALIFAASRNDRVIGRTMVLTVSIKIRNGFSQAGAPPGSKDASLVERLNLKLEIIRLNHRGSPKVKVKKRWEEELNTYGATPIKLTEIIIMNRATRIVASPFRCAVEVRILCSLIMLMGIDKSQKICPPDLQNIG